jgi:hypothetical protein
MKEKELRQIIKEEITSALEDLDKGSDIRAQFSQTIQGSVDDEEIASIIEDALDTIYDLGNDLDGRELLKMFQRALIARSDE